MDLNSTGSKIALAAVIVGAISATAVIANLQGRLHEQQRWASQGGFGSASTEDDAAPAADLAPAVSETPEVIAARAMTECDMQASHPADPNRFAAGVADEAMAPGIAVQVCENALALNPGDPRLEFQLGRAYWIASRHSDALSYFASAADKGYAPAMAYLGDAYVSGLGLPPNVAASSTIALSWHEQAASGGFKESEAAVEELRDAIRKNTFDRNLFQNPEYMENLYYSRGLDETFPAAQVYYMMGIASMLDSQEALFLDQSCKPLMSKLGNDVLPLLSAVASGAQIFQPDEYGEITTASLFLGVVKTAGTEAFKQYPYDQGRRDGSVLFDPEVYGCRSEVTQQIVDNIMITSRR